MSIKTLQQICGSNGALADFAFQKRLCEACWVGNETHNFQPINLSFL